jgi:hypothetical protein
MKAEHHAMIAVPTSISIWVLTNSVWYFLMSFFLGFLIDVDHVFDYIREERKFDFKHMFIKSYEGNFKKIYLVFHCLEYIPLAWIICAFTGNFTFAAVFTLAYLSHMIPDMLANNAHPYGYFLFYRFSVGFDMHRIFHQDKITGKTSGYRKHMM